MGASRACRRSPDRPRACGARASWRAWRWCPCAIESACASMRRRRPCVRRASVGQIVVGRTCSRGRSDTRGVDRDVWRARCRPREASCRPRARRRGGRGGSGGMCVALDVRRARVWSWSCERCEGWGVAMDTKMRRVLVSYFFYIARRRRLRVTGRRRRRRRRWRHARGRLCRCA